MVDPELEESVMEPGLRLSSYQVPLDGLRSSYL